MSFYTLDFSSLAVGTGVPAGFTWLRNPGSEVIDIQEAVDYLDGKALRVRATATDDWRALGIDAVDIPSGEDFDIVWRVMNVGSGGSNWWAEGAFARFDPAAGTSGRFAAGYGYSAGTITKGRSGEEKSNWDRLGTNDNFLAHDRQGRNVWHWFRFRAVDDRFKLVCSVNEADIALDGAGEPVAGWDDDTAYTWQPAVSSPVGFTFWRMEDEADQVYDYFSVGWGTAEYAESPSQLREVDEWFTDGKFETTDLSLTDTVESDEQYRYRIQAVK